MAFCSAVDDSKGIELQPTDKIGYLTLTQCFQVAHGSYKRREAVLWQKISPVNDYATLVRLLTTDIAPEHRGPGTYMYDALKYARPVAEPTATDLCLVALVLTATPFLDGAAHPSRVETTSVRSGSFVSVSDSHRCRS